MISWPSDVEPAPRILVLPEAAASLDEALAAIELWEHYKRRRLDPAQRLAVMVMMAEDAHGNWAAATTGRSMPRQQGKGDEIEVPELWGLVQRAEAILHTVHDAVLLATQAQERLLSVLQGHADLRRKVKRVWKGTGQQMIELRNGGTIWYRTRTNGGGRGVDDVDRLVVDEAQHATVEHLAALSPTLLANSNGQLNALGSGGIADRSDWWWQMRIRALGNDPGSLGYMEHTVERVYLDADGVVVQEPVDIQNRALWPNANPALHAGRGKGMPYYEEQLRRLGPTAFGREHGNVWDPPPVFGGFTIPAEAWARCCVPNADRGEPRGHTIDVAPDGASAALAASDGLTVVVLEHGPGIHWVVPALRRLGIKRVWGDWKGPAGALLQDIEEAEITAERVSPEEHAQACGAFLAAVKYEPERDEPLLVQHTGQPMLDDAVAGAKRRAYGQAWAWDRVKADVDISPLVAVTIARRAALEAPLVTEADFFTL